MGERARRERAFILVEMLAVVLILGLVAILVMVNVMRRVDWARVETTKVKMRALEGALEMFQVEERSYPATDPGLMALVSTRDGERGFVRDEEALEDAWRRRFGYESPGRQRRSSYDLWSFGRDGAAGGDGPDADITNWETGRRLDR